MERVCPTSVGFHFACMMLFFKCGLTPDYRHFRQTYVIELTGRGTRCKSADFKIATRPRQCVDADKVHGVVMSEGLVSTILTSVTQPLLSNKQCVLLSFPPGSFGTTQPMGAAVFRKQAAGTFGPPVEALRNDPAKYLKKGTKSPTGTGLPSDDGGAGGGDSKKGPSHAFAYPGER